MKKQLAIISILVLLMITVQCNEKRVEQLNILKNENSMNSKKIEHTEALCEKSEDCPKRYNCNEDTQKCQRQDIFPLQAWDYIGIISLSFFATLTTSAGIGGGEIIVPTIKILFQYIQAEASTLSQCCIMMAGITRFILNYNKKHPYRDAVAIEYKVAMLLMPSIFFGLSLGVMLHKIVPNFVQEIALLLVLILCFYESMKKGIIVWREETNEMKQNPTKFQSLPSCDKPSKRIISDSDEDSEDSEYSDYTHKSSFLFIAEPKRTMSLSVVRGDDRLLRYSTKAVELIKEDEHEHKSSSLTIAEEILILEQKDNSHWQFDKLAPIWGIFVILIIQTVLKDGDFAGIKNCSSEFWSIYIIYALLCFAAVIYSALRVKKDYEYRSSIGFPDYKGNVVLNTRKIF